MTGFARPFDHRAKPAVRGARSDARKNQSKVAVLGFGDQQQADDESHQHDYADNGQD
jgi:hypothetical protein